MYDDIMYMNSATRDYFLALGERSSYQITDTKGILVEQTFSISEIAIKHNRRVYNFWMWLAMIGGIITSLMIVFNWLVAPFAKFGFQMRAIKRLYWVRTSDEKLFNEKPKDKNRYKRDFEES
jgi:hypothetical protein